MRWISIAVVLFVGHAANAGLVTSFNDIELWTGNGAKLAAIAIDWTESSSIDQSLVWGYRWDGDASGEDMFRTVVSADPRLFAKFQDFGGSLGVALYGVGYDDGDGVFGLNDGTVFNAAGIAAVAGPADGAAALDPGDIYHEGWFLGFWHYAVSMGNPFSGGTWSSSGIGMTGRVLADGDWDSWAFTPTFSLTAYATNPFAAPVPEPSSAVLILLAAPFVAVIVRRRASAMTVIAIILASSSLEASEFATEVVSYTAGTPVGVGNPALYQTNGSQSLGSPSHDTLFGSQVGVFYPAFGSSELVIVGAGGQLTVKFDHQVENDSQNPFGIDLLVFGNAFFTRSAQGLATNIAAEPGVISVSKDGAAWFDIPNVFADDLFPTLGYTNTVYSGFDNLNGTILTDFTKPVDPSFNPIGKTEAQIEAAYAGTGGGTGVDLSSVGLDWIQYVRVSQPAGQAWSTEIDAFSDVAVVPEPSSVVLAIVGAVALAVHLAEKRRVRLTDDRQSQ